ncbi:hypothetical protein GGI09_004164 [Coemansia sp. S100]|nr:hypothetical protein GGI09_004164 [Coemansia sp. S100]
MPVDYIEEHYFGAGHTDKDYRTLNYLGYPTHHMAKDISVYLNERTVYSGVALEMISRAPYAGCSFPLARKISFIFVKEMGGEGMVENMAMDEDFWMDEDVEMGEDTRADEDFWKDPLRVETNIAAFVKRIRQMAPLASEILVRASDRDRMPRIASWHFSDLATQLYQLANRVEYYYGLNTDDSMRLQLYLICNLTHISYTSYRSSYNVYQFIQLARNNASTLQSLDLECAYVSPLLGLVQDASANHVTYPCLQTLTLWGSPVPDEPGQSASRGAVPFPILRRLNVEFEGLFDDDTFFRGNAATLEVLAMPLSPSSLAMLRQYRVFEPGSHPKLQSVKLTYTDESGSQSLASLAEAMQFMLKIGPDAPVREYDHSEPLQDQLDFPALLGDHACIQVLSLPSWSPDLWQVISLIKSLPLLLDLRTMLPRIGPIPDGVTMAALPEHHVISNYALVGKRLRRWRVNRGHVDNYAKTATCVLILVLACPNFDRVSLPYFQPEMFIEQMEIAITSDPFKPHAPRLGRLMFDGWNGRQP